MRTLAAHRGGVRPPKKFVGKWSITETQLWDREALDTMVPANVTFGASGRARFEMICVVGEMDCEFVGDRAEFTWAGNDEADEASGRGWAEIKKDGTLRGRIYFHHGDNSTFVARRAESGAKTAKGAPTKSARAR
jgi:hypothetical protein